MPLTIQAFRAQFAEFASAADYPDPAITPWLTIAQKMVNPDRWGDLTDFGVGLWLAHNLTLNRKAAQQAARGKAPGQTTGVMSSKSLDGASISYDTSVASENDAGWWNLTTYGQQYFRYSRMFGAGPVQIGTGPSGGNISAYSWPGVIPPGF